MSLLSSLTKKYEHCRIYYLLIFKRNGILSCNIECLTEGFGVFVLNRKLLTAEGYQRLQDELNNLVRKERPEITKIVSWAASLGDRSENAD